MQILFESRDPEGARLRPVAERRVPFARSHPGDSPEAAALQPQRKAA
jgi:hypothetical protein